MRGIWCEPVSSSPTRSSPSPHSRATTCCPGCGPILLSTLRRFAEAKAEFERAAAMTRNERERDLLLGRAEAYARLKTRSQIE
jgi:hypothetical protein